MSDNEFNDVLLTLLRSRYDVQKSKSEGYANDLNNVQSEFVKRNKSLTNLLNNYIEEKERKVKAKEKAISEKANKKQSKLTKIQKRV